MKQIFKNPKKLLGVGISGLLLTWGLVYTNCGSSKNSMSNENATGVKLTTALSSQSGMYTVVMKDGRKIQVHPKQTYTVVLKDGRKIQFDAE